MSVRRRTFFGLLAGFVAAPFAARGGFVAAPTALATGEVPFLVPDDALILRTHELGYTPEVVVRWSCVAAPEGYASSYAIDAVADRHGATMFLNVREDGHSEIVYQPNELVFRS